MQLLDHYLRLSTHLQDIKVGEGTPITLGEIASVLCCTERNGKLTIKKMEELNWLTWQPGRGRGNYSVLTLLIQPADLLLGKAQELVQKGDIRSAITLVHDYTQALPSARDRFHQWLSSHFGYRVETRDEHTIDTLRTFYTRPFLALDPAFVMLRSENHLVKQLFDCLVRYNTATGSIEPHLAHHWESNEDTTEWTLYLRKSVLFHHGRELTARDVVFTLNRLRNPLRDSPYRWMFTGISNVRAMDDRTVQITLGQPNHLFLHFLSNEHASIIPHDYCEEMGHQFARLPVGTGPFKLIRNDETMLVLEAFAPYFRERALLDRMEIWIVPNIELVERADPNTHDLHYQSADTLPAQTEQQVAEQMEKGLQLLTFNLAKHGPQQHEAFREAIHRLLDRKRMITELGGTRAEVAYSLNPETQQVEDVVQNPSDVQRLLQESGYRGETLRLFTFDHEDHIEDVSWIQSQCGQAGISIEAVFLPVAELTQVECIRQADLILDGATFHDNIELSYLDLLLTPTNFIYEHLGSQLRAFVEQHTTHALATASKPERAMLLLEIERRLIAERMLLCLYRNRVAISAHPDLHGLALDAHGFVDYRNLWFKIQKKTIPNIRKPEYTG